MNVYIYDSNHVLIDIIDSFNSLIWTEKYNEPSEFELFLPATEKLLKLFSNAVEEGYFAAINDSDEMMIIDNIVCKTENQGVKYLTIQGRGLITILERRLQLGSITFNSTESVDDRFKNKSVYDIIEWFLNFNIIKPQDYNQWLTYIEGVTTACAAYYRYNYNNRKISNFKMAEKALIQDPYGKIAGTNAKKPLDFTVGDTTVYDVVKTLCDKYNLGFKIIYQNEKYIFHIYDGYDLENIQFTPLFDNISDINTLKTSRGKINAAVLKTNQPLLQDTSEEGSDPSWEYFTSDDLCMWDRNGERYHNLKAISGQYNGLSLYEGFVDGEVKIELRDGLGNIISGSDTDEAYRNRAEKEIKKKLDKNYKDSSILECTVANDDFYKAKVDYNIGDIVYVTDYGGITNKMRVMELVYSYNSEGYKIYPSFSLWEEDGED